MDNTEAACLGNIPAVIIADILSYGIPEHEGIPQQLKAMLQFGFINKHWHRAVLSIVSRYVCFEHGMPDTLALRRKDTLEIARERQEACTSSNTKIITNIDNATCANLTVYCLRTPIEGLERLLSHMSTYCSVWENITKLEVSIKVNSYLSVWRTQDASKCKADIETLCESMANLMPNIRSISTQGSSLHPVVRELCSEISKRYSSKLTKLSSSIPLAVPRKLIFTSLTCVNIDLKHIHDFEMPRISAETIVSLQISGNMNNLNWSLFSVETSVDVVVLPNLLYLTLDLVYKKNPYGSSYDLEPLQQKAYLPRLKRLKLSTTTSECRFFKVTRLPSKMDSLRVVAPSLVIRSLEKCGMPQVDNLQIDR